MSNVKSKFSLSFVMLLVVIMSIGSVFAADEVNRIFNLSATYQGQALSNNQTITIDESKKDGKIDVTVAPKYVDDSLTIVYIWGSSAMETAATGSKTASIPFPNLKAGTTTLLQIEAYINDQKDNYVGNSNVLRVYVKVPQETTLTANLKDGNTTVSVGSTIEKEVGDVLSVVTSSNRTVKQIFYRWNSEELKTVNSSTTTITVPNYVAGSKNKLAIQAVTDDGFYSEGRVYYVEIKEDEVTVEPETKVSVTISKVSDSEVKLNAKVENDTFSKFVYNWDGEANKTLTVNPSNVTVPTTVGTHTLTVTAYAADGTTGKATYKFTVEAPEVVDDELIVEPWMKEDNSMDELAVSLRNDSDKYDKANKNFYALNEEVVYYVDYKNGGDDITRAVKLVLELPLDFKVIDSFGGVVDSEENTITWSFPEGLEEDQAGTKVVKVAYKSLSKSSKRYEIVYPVADIYERNKVIDSSAVINYIFKDEETEIKDEHYPYMFGDADADTFRPDDTITRAEGALVLTRIFGIDTSGTTVEALFPDLNETYVEAQKAIVAATKLGLINGYPDGTYRPNAKMTKAEFMKIIASYIEANAENEEIRGLEVKEDTNIKIYKNPTNMYITGTTTVNQHWASDFVTMLVRLNMTAVSSSNKNLGLDKEITRAEVAQLVNFYLLRAPADVSSSTKTGFSDVSKKHDLFEDIVEATRAEHTYTMTKEGYEVEVEIED